MPTSARQKITKVFHIDYRSELDDVNYQGSFTCRKLSIQDRTKMGVVKAQLNGGMHYDENNPGHGVDPTTDEFNAVLAHLTVALTDAPSWWKLDNISDIVLIYTVYKEVAEHEASFRRERGDTKESGSTGEGSSLREDRQSDEPGTNSQVVGEEVQSALEP